MNIYCINFILNINLILLQYFIYVIYRSCTNKERTRQIDTLFMGLHLNDLVSGTRKH